MSCILMIKHVTRQPVSPSHVPARDFAQGLLFFSLLSGWEGFWRWRLHDSNTDWTIASVMAFLGAAEAKLGIMAVVLSLLCEKTISISILYVEVHSSSVLGLRHNSGGRAYKWEWSLAKGWWREWVMWLLLWNRRLGGSAWLGAMLNGFFLLLVALNAKVEFLELVGSFSDSLKPHWTNHGLL